VAADYRATRPKVERKLADLVRRRQRVGDQDPLVGQEGDAREGEQRERQDDEGNRPAAHTVEGTDRARAAAMTYQSLALPDGRRSRW
jgi:hypothetical protein